MGHCSVGAVTFDSAVYCAKYALKKVNGEASEDHYTVFDRDGVLHERRPEFALMSRRPGIGAGYLERCGEEVLDHDNVIVEGRPQKLPRYYDERAKAVEHRDSDQFVCLCRVCRNKRRRKREAMKNRSDNTP